MSITRPDFSIAVLGYRAGEDIEPFVEGLHRSLSETDVTWEIVIVANYWPGTGDSTPAVARRLCERLSGVRVIAEEKGGDMGWDMRAGLAACRGRHLGVVDGDGQFPVAIIGECLDTLMRPDVDLVKTYRSTRGDGVYRRVLSRIYNSVFSLLFPKLRGHRDANSKPKLMTRSAYESMTLTADDWFIDAEIMLEATDRGLRIVEIPVAFDKLDHRRSFVRPRAILEFVVNLVRRRIRRRR